jgi:hypothetical protein
VRINVYAEELTTETKFVTKIVDGRRSYGIRLWLESSDRLHHTEADDDRSAITFWVPWFDGKNHHVWTEIMFGKLYATAVLARKDDEEKCNAKL